MHSNVYAIVTALRIESKDGLHFAIFIELFSALVSG